MRKKSSVVYGEGKYYFIIKSPTKNITIHHKLKEMAAAAFRSYKQAGKEIQWLGKWDGKAFVESNQPGSN